MSETGDLISRIYANFRGCDFRGEEINLTRSPDCLNVWRDYKETESIRTRPGLERANNLTHGDKIYGVYFYSDMMIVHSGEKLYTVAKNTTTGRYTGPYKTIYENAKKAVSDGFIYDNKWYFKDGKNYLCYDGTSVEEVVGHIPTTSIGRKGGKSGGTIYEDVNLLSEYRINTFLANGEYVRAEGTHVYDSAQDYYNPKRNGDYIQKVTVKTIVNANGETETDTIVEYVKVPKGEYNYKDNQYVAEEYGDYYYTGDKVFYLDTPDIDEIVSITIDDVEITAYSVDTDEGKITFNDVPSAPLTDGQDNIVVKFKKAVTGYKEKILGCTLLQVFDNRVFVSGNPDYPNTVWHCSLNDPTYFSDLDYYHEGLDKAAIKGLVAGNNALWVFREPSESNTTVFYHTPTIDSEYGKIYPSQHSSITTGCIGRAVNFNDDIIFFSERGMEGISGDVTTEQAVAHRSSLVDRKLIAEKNYSNMVLAEWEGYLLVFIGNKVYLADSRTAFTYEDHTEYDWFYWELEHNVTCAKVHEGILYIGSDDGKVYTLTDNECAIESYWTTPKDKFKSPHKLKTTNKRGCVVEAEGDISVYAKIEDTGFELIGTYQDIKDYFVSRIKRKKFKDIQLKFHSNTRFSLETATLECFIGGYIKR